MHRILMVGLLALLLSGCSEPDWKKECAMWAAGDADAQDKIDDEVGATAAGKEACPATGSSRDLT